MKDRCETRAGEHQCMFSKGHNGPCEAQAKEYSRKQADESARIRYWAMFAERHGRPIPEPKK